MTAELKTATPVSSACCREMEAWWCWGLECKGLNLYQSVSSWEISFQAPASKVQSLNTSLPLALLAAYSAQKPKSCLFGSELSSALLIIETKGTQERTERGIWPQMEGSSPMLGAGLGITIYHMVDLSERVQGIVSLVPCDVTMLRSTSDELLTQAVCFYFSLIKVKCTTHSARACLPPGSLPSISHPLQGS